MHSGLQRAGSSHSPSGQTRSKLRRESQLPGKSAAGSRSSRRGVLSKSSRIGERRTVPLRRQWLLDGSVEGDVAAAFNRVSTMVEDEGGETSEESGKESMKREIPEELKGSGWAEFVVCEQEIPHDWHSVDLIIFLFSDTL